MKQESFGAEQSLRDCDRSRTLSHLSSSCSSSPERTMDDDDEFLYGTSAPAEPKHAPQIVPYEKTIPASTASNGVVSAIESDAQEDSDIFGTREVNMVPEAAVNGNVNAQEEEEEEEVDLGDESDEDLEIITEATPRSLDFRQGARVTSTSRAPQSIQPRAPGPSLTTEYTPRSRSGISETAPQPPSQQASLSSITSTTPAQPQTQTHIVPPPGATQPLETELTPSRDEDSVNTSSLPPVTAPPSHPTIDPNAVGVFDGRSILDVDLNAMSEKPWRRPGSDISDWFNYGFDEISWEAYCYRRRELGEMANVLKANVINFSAMTEDQLTALPPEVRQMVMTGTTTMMNGGANAGMMAPSVMMDMSGMMAPMGMGIDMGMGAPMMQMQDGGQMQQGGVVNTGTPEQSANVGMMQDGFAAQAQGDMVNLGMGGEYGMQQQNAMGQQMYQGMEGAPQVAQPAPVPAARGVAPAPYRARGSIMNRGRGFPGRGRGRGAFVGEVGPPPPAVRPASPLPPGVPTGPRNQNKYKDRDGNAPAVDGLDYGGTKQDRPPSGEPDERSTSRSKRRSSPGLDEGRGSKRR